MNCADGGGLEYPVGVAYSRRHRFHEMVPSVGAVSVDVEDVVIDLEPAGVNGGKESSVDILGVDSRHRPENALVETAPLKAGT